MSRTATDSLTFRYATEADTPAIVALIESAYRGEMGREGWTTESEIISGQRTDLEEIHALLATPSARFLLAEDDGALVACCLLDDQPPAMYFGMFAVSPKRQGAGLGDALIREAERRAVQEFQASTMRMSVIWLRSELIAWYERRGYKATGDRLPFPYGEPRAGVPVRDDLYFLVFEKPLSA